MDVSIRKFDLSDAIDKYVSTVWRTGSSYICNPPVLDTDRDFVLLVTDYDAFIAAAIDKGYTVCGNSEYEDKEFTALRQENVNLLVVATEELWKSWVSATELAKRFNLLNKADRVALFKVIVDGDFYIGSE